MVAIFGKCPSQIGIVGNTEKNVKKRVNETKRNKEKIKPFTKTRHKQKNNEFKL